MIVSFRWVHCALVREVQSVHSSERHFRHGVRKAPHVSRSIDGGGIDCGSDGWMDGWMDGRKAVKLRLAGWVNVKSWME